LFLAHVANKPAALANGLSLFLFMAQGRFLEEAEPGLVCESTLKTE
jgi:hypothetical protein